MTPHEHAVFEQAFNEILLKLLFANLTIALVCAIVALLIYIVRRIIRSFRT